MSSPAKPTTPQKTPTKSSNPASSSSPTKEGAAPVDVQPQTPSQRKRSEEAEILSTSPKSRSPPPGEDARPAKAPKTAETLSKVHSPKPFSL